MDQDAASVNHGDTIRCWVGVASLMKRGNELLFPSREKTRELIDSGEYLAVLRKVNPMLWEWQKEFDRAKCMSLSLSLSCPCPVPHDISQSRTNYW